MVKGRDAKKTRNATKTRIIGQGEKDSEEPRNTTKVRYATKATKTTKQRPRELKKLRLDI